MMELYALNLPKNLALPIPLLKGQMLLQSCQRNLLIGLGQTPLLQLPSTPLTDEEQKQFRHYRGRDAYRFMLSTFCGLQSKLLGETEIAAQFKETFTHYLQRSDRHPQLVMLVQKMFQDGKWIRQHYLQQVRTPSYPALLHQLIQQKIQITRPPILLLGSGLLAQKMAKGLTQKYSLYVSARNRDKLSALQQQLGANTFQIIPFESQRWTSFPVVVSTLAPKTTQSDSLLPRSFCQSFFERNQTSEKPLLIDLSMPVQIPSDFINHPQCYQLNHLFALQNQTQERNQARLIEIEEALTNVVNRRYEVSEKKYQKYQDKPHWNQTTQRPPHSPQPNLHWEHGAVCLPKPKAPYC